MIKNSEPSGISMTSAIAQLRMGNLNDLSPDKLAALREAITVHPSITGFDGCTDALERLDAAELQRSVPPQNTGSSLPESNRKNWLPVVAGVAALVAMLLGIGFFVSWFRQRLAAPLVAATEQAPAVIALPATVGGTPPPETPAENPVVAEEDIEAVQQVAPPETPAVAEAAPKPELVKENTRPTMVVSGAGARLLDEPDGGYLLTSVNGSDLVKLSGKAPRLVLSELNGQCNLDLGEFQCPLVEFRGDINGLAKITVKSAGAAIEFRGSINGNPHISINAPGGKVRFFQNVEGSATLLLDVPGGQVSFAGNETDQAALGGGVSVQVTADTVEFSGGMDAGARADVTLGGNGTLRFSRLNGGSSISYRKTDDSDPAPTVEGDLSGTGKLIADAAIRR